MSSKALYYQLYYKELKSYRKKPKPNVVPMSEKTKEKIRIKQTGKKASEETKRKMRITFINRICQRGKLIRILGKNEKELLDKQELIDKCKIKRQYHIKYLGYIVDGYCRENKTVYEVYEKHHNRPKQRERDRVRQKNILEYLGGMYIIISDGYYPV
jgi:hypothetical protein